MHPATTASPLRRALHWAGLLPFTLALLLCGLFGALALWYRLPLPAAANGAAALAWAVAALAAIIFSWRGRARVVLVAAIVAMALLLAWWSTIAPSNHRVWADDVSRQLAGRIDGDVVTLENVRNFNWRTDEDYDARWETRQYRLSALRSVDMAVSYWMGPAIAHTLVSFGFDDGKGGIEHVAFSVEIRKEKGEAFSAIAGFFKQFELGLVAADERDILRVRTNVRGEDVYLYSVRMTPAAMRSLFLAYVDEAAQLRKAPRFYDTLTANCTTIVFDMARHIVPGLPMDYRLVASGYLPEYLYDLGALAPGKDVATLHAAGHITDRARANGESPQFSEIIRQGVPAVPATSGNGPG